MHLTVTLANGAAAVVEKEKERKKFGGGGVAKDQQVGRGARNKYCCSEGSQAMPASPSDSVKFKFNVKNI
jgi:hypothetical protein